MIRTRRRRSSAAARDGAEIRVVLRQEPTERGIVVELVASRGKADFGDIYVQPDPRAYFDRLGALGYEVPRHGQRVFECVLESLDVADPLIVDLCSSYGVNAALMKHDLELADLYRHYGGEGVAAVAPDVLANIDREFFANCRRDDPPRVVGVDAATAAIEYAVDVGLLDLGFAENLEVDDPSPELGEVISQADLITVTGGVGYITERTFDRLLGCVDADERPWVASLCLRTVSYRPVADCLAGYGYVTEHLEAITPPQRRFADDDERDFALAALEALGIDASGKESEGRYHVSVYLSRPAGPEANEPIGALLAEIGTS